MYNRFLLALVAIVLLAACNNQPAPATEAPKEDASLKAIAAYNKFGQFMLANQFDSAAALMAPDAVDHPAGWPELHGRDSIIAMIKMWSASSKDMKMEVMHVTSDGEYVMAHYRFTGTALPNAMGMPMKGGAFDYTGMEMVRINAEGLMTDHWDYPDWGTFAKQVGLDMAAMSPPPAEVKK